jgi:iron complex outermembrane receptor protein
LTQQGFASTARGYVVVNGVITGLSTTALVQPDSAIGQALGAKPLKPEHSINLSGGLSFNPSPRLTVTLDGYLIWLNNRISQTGNLFGAGVDAILAGNGQATGQLISYYTNAIDTRTAGLDLVADYRHQIGRAKVNWTLGFNYNQTSITHIAATPAQLAGLGLTLFDRVAQGYITVGNPRTKVILTNNTTLGRFETTLRLQRYGAVQLLTTGAVNDQYYGARIITDLEVGYRLSDRLHAAVGANNLLNIYPARSTIVDASGSSPMPRTVPSAIMAAFIMPASPTSSEADDERFMAPPPDPARRGSHAGAGRLPPGACLHRGPWHLDNG